MKVRTLFISALALILPSLPIISTPADATQNWTLKSLQSQTLNWSDCNIGFLCASFKVPVDYNHIDSNTITLQAIKHSANNPSKRIGSLIMNPGGPGGSGIQ